MRWVWRVLWMHRRRCKVCAATGRVALSLLAPFYTGARTIDGGRHSVMLASRLAEVTIPCPHCTDATRLLKALPGDAGWPVGGDAA